MSSKAMEHQLVSSWSMKTDVPGVVACFLSSISLEDARPRQTLTVILDNFKRKIRFVKSSHGKPMLLQVDKNTFEKDIAEGALGETAAIHLLHPKILVNGEYLKRQAMLFKKRLIHESVENLILDYSFLASEILIEPRYFIYDIVLRRIRLYPPFRRSLMEYLRSLEEEASPAFDYETWHSALEMSVEEGLLEKNGTFFSIREEPLNDVLRRPLRLHVFKPMRQILKSHLVQSVAGAIGPLRLAQGAIESSGLLDRRQGKHGFDAKRYIVLPSKHGFNILSDETTIEEYVEQQSSFGKECLGIKRLGGVLNDVYLIEFSNLQKAEKVVAKKFMPWADFKWSTLAIWAIGTRNFCVRAKTRMARECWALQYLKRHGLAVPEIIRVSWDRSLLFTEYIEGTPLGTVTMQCMKDGVSSTSRERLLYNAGEVIAKIHGLNLTIGDCKPENMIAQREGRIYLVDLEQTARDGNKPWDIAEFLFFASRYAGPSTDAALMRRMFTAFTNGYLAGGGTSNIIRQAASPWLTKVFTALVLPNVIYEVTKFCSSFNKT